MSLFVLDYNYTDGGQEFQLDSSVDISDPAPGTTPGAGTGAMLWTGTAASPTVIPSDVLPPPTYLGAFRLSNTAIERTTYAYAALAGRNVGGQTRLYLTASHTGLPSTMVSQLVEIIDPGTYSATWQSSPIATCNFLGNEFLDKRVTWRADTGIQDDFGDTKPPNDGLFFNPDTNLFYFTFADTYDTSALQTHGLLAISLNDSTGATVGYGPFSLRIVDGNGAVRRGPRAGMWLARHPDTGEMMSTATITSGDASCTWGPSLHRGGAWPTASTPVGFNEVINMPTRALFYYYMGPNNINTAGELIGGAQLKSWRHRLRPGPYEYSGETPCGPADIVLNVNPATYVDAIGPTGSFRSMDRNYNVVYVQIGAKAGYFWTMELNDGHTWYQNTCHPTCPNHGISAPDTQTTGPVTTSAYPALCCYSANTITQVQNGVIQDWQAEPSYVVDMQIQYPGFRVAPVGTPGPFKTVSIGHYDSTTRKLYMVAARADSTRGSLECSLAGAACGPLIHVFQWPANP